MEIYPAIDLRGGQVVRLSQGDYNKTEIYSANPPLVATEFLNSGSKFLHVVDLDGAKEGTPKNFETIKQLAQIEGLFIQVGGGIRDEARIKAYLELGVDRVILGTIATENPDFVYEMVEKYGDAIAVGVDAKDGKVAVKGWTEITDLDAPDFCAELAEKGVSAIIFTDISKDGMMMGANLEIYKLLSSRLPKTCKIIASGGVSSMKDVEELSQTDIHGAIIGKALYLNAISLTEAIKTAKR